MPLFLLVYRVGKTMKIIKRSYIFVLLCFILALSCREGGPTNIEWHDADTLRITAVGVVEEGGLEESIVIKREKACSAARLNAMASAAVILGEADASSVTDFQQEGIYFSAFIRGGSELNRTFDPKTNRCVVVYELKEKGLKEKAKRASRKK
ncbi:MAG: hypothetical protein FWG92_04175 [Leptospirales bacterium]|nr:hypothetical protein [Leptospirales bacterium]